MTPIAPTSDAANENLEPSGPFMKDFEYELLPDMAAVRLQIKACEGRHVQQVAYSSYMDALTQVCFTCQRVRSSIVWDGRSWAASEDPGIPTVTDSPAARLRELARRYDKTYGDIVGGQLLALADEVERLEGIAQALVEEHASWPEDALPSLVLAARAALAASVPTKADEDAAIEAAVLESIAAASFPTEAEKNDG